MNSDKFALYTMRDLLFNDIIRRNQTKLAKLLKIHRHTVGKFADDLKGEHHVIIYRDSVYQFFSSPNIKK